MRYARWDLGQVALVDPRQGTILAALYPLDRQANADGQRLLFPLDAAGAAGGDHPPGDRRDASRPPGQESSEPERPEQELPPLLKQILDAYSATGIPPAYLPKHPPANQGEAS